MSLDLAPLVFHHIEHHRHDRIVVRGTFAGRYVDRDERGDVISKRTAEGALTGAMVGCVEGHGGRLVRHHPTPDAALALEAAVAGDPRVTPWTGG
jgi:hypothetical protein